MTTTEAPPQTGATLAFIEEQSSRTDYFGPSELKTTFGVEALPPAVPPLFSNEIIVRALQRSCCIVQQIGTTAEGIPLTLQHLYTSRENKDALDGKFLYKPDWYGQEPLYTTQVPRSRLFIKGRNIIPGSNGKTFIGESLIAADFIEELFGDALPESYGNAIEELRSDADRLEKLSSSDWQEAARQCVALAFSRFFRESPVEVLYRVLLAQKVNRERLFERMYTRTNVLSANGVVVDVGGAVAVGAGLDGWGPYDAGDDLGFSFSCSGELELAN